MPNSAASINEIDNTKLMYPTSTPSLTTEIFYSTHFAGRSASSATHHAYAARARSRIAVPVLEIKETSGSKTSVSVRNSSSGVRIWASFGASLASMSLKSRGLDDDGDDEANIGGRVVGTVSGTAPCPALVCPPGAASKTSAVWATAFSQASSKTGASSHEHHQLEISQPWPVPCSEVLSRR